MLNEIAVGERLTVFCGLRGERQDLPPDAGVGDIRRMDGDAEEGVVAKLTEEKMVPPQADDAARGAADAPAQ